MAIRVFSLHLRPPIVLLAVIEATLFFFSAYLAAAILQDGDATVAATPGHTFWLTALTYATWSVTGNLAMGLYSIRQRSGRMGLAVRLLAANLVAVALCALVFYFFPSIQVAPGLLGLAVCLGVASCFVLRMLFDRIVDQDYFKRRVLVYGAGHRASSLMALRRRVDQRGFMIVGFMPTDGDQVAIPADRQVEPPENLYEWTGVNRVDEIVVAMDDRRRGFPLHEFLECRLAGIDVIELPSFLERESGKLRLDVTSPSWFIFGEGFRASPIQQSLERGFDVLASAALLILSAPFMALTALAIKLEDGWSSPVFYRQRRVGQHGRVFEVVKFRSMRVGAERPGEAKWATSNDPRVTRVGTVIRKTRLDELPQLLNVLRGDMSFVGPRPERPEFVEQLEQTIPYYRERHAVKPGITGWAQLCYPYGASEKDAWEKLQYDLYYVKNRSLVFDLAIIVQTVEVVLWGKGAR